jgi:hypothetical protein
MKTYKEYKDFWDIFLNKWLRNHDDFILNDSEGQAFFPKDSGGKYINADLYANITCMPEPYYFGRDFLNATNWTNFKDAVVVLDLNPGLSHDSDYRKTKGTHTHDILDDLAIGSYSTTINPKYSPFISTNPTIPGVTWWKSKRLGWLNRFLPQGNIRDKVFAFELCPFHSKSWNVKLDSNSIDFVKDYVLDPVVSILAGNGKKRLGFCFGKDWENVLNILGFQEVAQWGIDYDCPGKPFVSPAGSELKQENWIEKGAGPANRIYKLYQGNIKGKEIYLLCLRACGTFVAPSQEFMTVEEKIKADLKNLYSISL